MRTALLAASLALVAATTVACGDDQDTDSTSAGASSPSGAPTDASTEDFCGTFEDFVSETQALGAEPTAAQVVDALKGVAETLQEVGTPEDVPADARAGFELVVTTIEELPQDATEQQVSELDKDFSEEESAQSDAFDAYLQETCQPAGEPAPPQ